MNYKEARCNRNLTYAERFWLKVDISSENECWNWIASKYRNGYGQVSIRRADGSKTMGLSHRVAYQLTFGEIPEGMVVCHRCDNPACCNPTHLFLGTTRDNINDKMSKGRASGNYHCGEEHGNSKLTMEKARELRDFRASLSFVQSAAESRKTA